MKTAAVFEAGDHRWSVLYDQDEQRVIDSNVYVVESNGQSAVLDPGGYEVFPQVLAAVVAGAEQAAVRYWVRQAKPSSTLPDVVRTAVAMAVRGMAGGS